VRVAPGSRAGGTPAASAAANSTIAAPYANAKAGAQENYTFREVDGNTEVLVEMDTTAEHRELFEATWPRALEKLNALAEG
jgi:hypothetical protein